MEVKLEKLSADYIPDGKYQAVWGGFTVTIHEPKTQYHGIHFESDIGIKTMAQNVLVTIKDGVATLNG